MTLSIDQTNHLFSLKKNDWRRKNWQIDFLIFIFLYSFSRIDNDSSFLTLLIDKWKTSQLTSLSNKHHLAIIFIDLFVLVEVFFPRRRRRRFLLLLLLFFSSFSLNSFFSLHLLAFPSIFFCPSVYSLVC